MKRIFFLLLVTQSLFGQKQYDFAIYHDSGAGAWEDGIIAFEQFLDWKGVSHNRVTAQDINNSVLKDSYRGIYFPGGDADYYSYDINATGIQNIQELVADDGAYIGICAGAEFACDKLIWQDITIDYPLKLFMGEAVGPIDELAVWPDNAMATLSMNLSDEINQFEPAHEDILYWGGTVFNAYEDTYCDTVASYDGFGNEPAIIKFGYGSGRVLLISPHPEIEEDSDRDSTDVAEEYNDNGSDWNFLWAATDWLLGHPISQPVNLAEILYSKSIQIFPNPTNGILNIGVSSKQKIEKLVVYNRVGQKVLISKPSNNTIDLSNLQQGLYIIKIQINNINISKMLVIKS